MKTMNANMRKSMLLIIISLLTGVTNYAQVSINTNGIAADASSMLDISSNAKGILIPRHTTAQRTGISSPANGLLVYDTDTDSFWHFDSANGGWVEIISSATSNINNLTDGKSDVINLFLGSDAGLYNAGGSNNTGVGIQGLKANTSGFSNTALGYRALTANTTGSDNTSAGVFSSMANTTGAYNTGFGAAAMASNTTGTYNTIVGVHANFYNVEGWNNTIVGAEAGKGSALHNKSGNVFLGYQAGYFETNSNKLYIENSNSTTPLIGGDFAADEVYINGTVKITGGAPGVNKVLTSDASGNATWEAPQAGASQINELSDGLYDGSSLFLGEYAGENDNGANDNVGIGPFALNTNTGGSRNTAIGFSALTGGTLGTDNTSVGNYSMYSNFSGNYNTAIGSLALYNILTGNYNTAIGYKSALSTTTGEYNTSVGNESLKSNTTGSVNTAIGQFSLLYSTGDHNTAVGGYASKRNTTGNYNVALGYSANYNNQAGSNNTIIGYEAGRSATTHSKSGNVFIGYKAGYSEVGDNKLYIENSNSSLPLIGGNFSVDEVYINGTIKITGGSPGAGKVLTSDADGNATWEAPAPIMPLKDIVVQLQAEITELKKEMELLKNK
ncbi:MAG: hypothetical protein GXO88_15230 [Chlorobi bacterium]|nr:hypothetical protein [Chlorobiota bacterium]